MTADPRAVEIITRAQYEAAPVPKSDDHGEHPWSSVPPQVQDLYRRRAQAVLDAFAAAGWSLLPPGGQGDEWRYYTVEADGDSTAYVLCRTDDACEWTYVHTGRYYLTLGEAANAATEHAKKHAADTPGEPA